METLTEINETTDFLDLNYKLLETQKEYIEYFETADDFNTFKADLNDAINELKSELNDLNDDELELVNFEQFKGLFLRKLEKLKNKFYI